MNRRSTALARLACLILLGVAAIPAHDAVAASGNSIRDVDV